MRAASEAQRKLAETWPRPRVLTALTPVRAERLKSQHTMAVHRVLPVSVSELPNRAGPVPRLLEGFLNRAPQHVIHAVATALARGRRLAPDPGWRFHIPGDDADQVVQFKRDIWTHYSDNKIQKPVVFRWYERLRIRLYLGNDLSLCLYVLGAFEPNEFVFLRDLLEPGMVVLDGGANDGLFSLYASRRVGPRGSVLAVEPSGREFARLTANIELNRLRNVLMFKLALGNRAGVTTLAVAEPQHAGMNAIDPRRSGQSMAAWTESHESVRLDTIDALVARSGVERLDLIKLDIEGSEVDAIIGARDAIARFRPTILLEVEGDRLASQGRTSEDLLEELAGLGYELWGFDAASGQLRSADSAPESASNAVAAPRGWIPPIPG